MADASINSPRESLDHQLNDRSLGTILPIAAGTDLNQDVDKSRDDWSGDCIRLPDSAQRHPRAVLGRQIAENHILGRYLLQRLADHCHSKTRRYEGERACGAVRLLDDSRLETNAPANFQEPIAVVWVHTIEPDKRFPFQER